MELGFESLIVLLLIFLNGLFSMTEMALVSARRTRLMVLERKFKGLLDRDRWHGLDWGFRTRHLQAPKGNLIGGAPAALQDGFSPHQRRQCPAQTLGTRLLGTGLLGTGLLGVGVRRHRRRQS